MPASFSKRQERDWTARMLERFAAREEADAPARRSDEELREIAQMLSDRYLDSRAVPTSITWSSRQRTRWGSCTPAEGTIRISDRLQGMPDWVVQSVVMHELVHLLVPDHGKDFQALMRRFPRADAAKGFLDGVSWAWDTPQQTS